MPQAGEVLMAGIPGGPHFLGDTPQEIFHTKDL